MSDHERSQPRKLRRLINIKTILYLMISMSVVQNQNKSNFGAMNRY